MIPSQSWVQFIGRPGPKLHVIVDTPAMGGGGYYLRYYVEGRKAALDKVEQIADAAELTAKFNELYGPLAQGGMESDYVLGRGRHETFSDDADLPDLVQEVADCYFVHFGDEAVEDDDDLALEDSSVEIRRHALMIAQKQTERLKPADLGPAPSGEVLDLNLDDAAADDFSEFVHNPFVGREVTRMEKVTFDFRFRIFRHWNIPTLTYDPSEPGSLLEIWQNYLGVPLSTPPKDEGEYNLLFSGALEEIAVSLQGYASQQQVDELMQIVAQVRQTGGAFYDHLEPFWDAMGWRYLDLQMSVEGEGPVHPAANAQLASLILALTMESDRTPADRLILDAFAHTRVTAHEVWACYHNFRPSSPERGQGPVDSECEVHFNEALTRLAFDLPRDQQARVIGEWREAYARFRDLMVFLEKRFSGGDIPVEPATKARG
ncbi:MAG: hypothetical protein KDH09_00570 [Chrysiogenetes bacterium]|nr:hypothetical protein [Chrysiogenetes bacterium]